MIDAYWYECTSVQLARHDAYLHHHHDGQISSIYIPTALKEMIASDIKEKTGKNGKK